MLTSYPACIYKDKDEDSYAVIFPDLGCATCGDTLDDAIIMAMDCLAAYLSCMWEDGDPVPPPSALEAIDPVAVLRDIDGTEEGCEMFVHMITVNVAEYAQHHFSGIWQRWVRLPDELARAADDQEIDLSELLKEALKKRLNMA